MVNVARFVCLLRRHVSLKTLMGISMIFVRGVINCNTDFTVYKFHCSSYSKQYVGSNITDFRYRFNNYKSAFCKVSKSGKPPKVNQEHFHQHFKIAEHNGMDDWRVTLIDRADNRKELGRREFFIYFDIV